MLGKTTQEWKIELNSIPHVVQISMTVEKKKYQKYGTSSKNNNLWNFYCVNIKFEFIDIFFLIFCMHYTFLE